MRPLRLELHGFTAYRDPVTIDFAGADLFALSGPTGSGKSSIIDGMCFALFGSVPRLDRRTVAPVISTGKVEARIRFDFTVGEQTYTAVRVVRRTASGATTKEARLEHEGQTLAGDADGMTQAVERLLGLGFEQFTKSVVLPQGEFARFLHDKPSARQELLVKLLDLGVYERMRGEASSRRVAAESAIELTQRHLQSLADATPEAVKAAGARVELLSALRTEIDETQPQLDELARRREEKTSAAAAAETAVAALAAIRVPDGVAELSAATAQAEVAAAEAAKAAEQAQGAVASAEQERAALGDAAVLQRIKEGYEQRETFATRIANGTQKVGEAEAAEQEAAAAVTAAAATLASATEALEDARREHAAHAVAATLVAGDPCPVCLQTVAAVPRRSTPPALPEAEAARDAAASAHEAAQKALTPLHEQRVRYQQVLASLQEQAAELEQILADAPPPDEVVASLSAITTADAALVAARERDRAARRALETANRALAAARERRDSAWAVFDAARDAVAAHAPPPASRDDLAGAWGVLAEWAATEAARRKDEAATARESAAAATADLEALQTKLTARCEECAVVVRSGGRARDAVADAVAGAQAEEQRLRTAMEQVELFQLEITGHQETAAVAKALADHLSARGFERWLLDEALGSLADGASTVLRELSGGQYSLTLDGQHNFVVIDHRSADEQRPARTLSGGETFLASLSLALTLAEHLTQLAVGTAPRLESIFLDEGFGTLDAETLDVVAAAIEELGARGRTVGIVTHVRELADRMPVRYDVRKGPGGSVVERIER